MARCFAPLDRARHLNRTAEQQQLFGEGGLTGVRVGDDGKGAAPLGLLLDDGRHSDLIDSGRKSENGRFYTFFRTFVCGVGVVGKTYTSNASKAGSHNDPQHAMGRSLP